MFRKKCLYLVLVVEYSLRIFGFIVWLRDCGNFFLFLVDLGNRTIVVVLKIFFWYFFRYSSSGFFFGCYLVWGGIVEVVSLWKRR